jgi:hypothetical protein
VSAPQVLPVWHVLMLHVSMDAQLLVVVHESEVQLLLVPLQVSAASQTFVPQLSCTVVQ